MSDDASDRATGHTDTTQASPAETRSVSVAVVGANFGAEFIPLYRSHPAVGRVALVDTDARALSDTADRLGVRDRFTSLDALLAHDDFDAVHIASPVRFHVDHTVAVLESGRHAACAVPMATSMEGIARINEAVRASGRTYMMMETMVYGREFFYARDMLARGEFGSLTYLRGTHVQDLDGFPRYWQGYPPLAYSTHALSPLLALADTRVRTVHALGSGRLTEERRGDFDNPFPLETALFVLDRDGLVAEVTVSFFQVGRTYQEGFAVYGTDRSLEWPQRVNEDPMRRFELQPLRAGHRGRHATSTEVIAPDRADLLPPELGRFTLPTVYDPGEGRPTTRIESHHAGSHPHLVHEFVTSVVTGRRPAVDVITAATWTAPGIAGHQSALAGGAEVEIPDFGQPTSFVPGRPGEPGA